MKKIITYFILLIPLFVNSQITTDTIYSGNKIHIDLSKSIISKLNKSINIENLCTDQEKVKTDDIRIIKNAYGERESHIPYFLNKYCKESNSKVLKSYDAIIYSTYCNTYDPITETYVLEFFYKNEQKANECIKILKKLINNRMSKDKYDKEILIGTYNWFFISKENRVYFVHRHLDDDMNNQITNNLKDKILSLLLQ